MDASSESLRPLKTLLTGHDDWLMNRLYHYARKHNYLPVAASVEDAWRRCVKGLTSAILQALDTRYPDLEFGPDDDFKNDPVCTFIMDVAIRHRERGVSLEMFQGLMFYYKQAWLDLVKYGGFEQDQARLYLNIVGRVFDRMIIGVCAKWTESDQSGLIAELQARNQAMSREKDGYLTIFEGVPNPVLIVDDQKRIVDLNLAASVMLDASTVHGSQYYLKTLGQAVETPPDKMIAQKKSDSVLGTSFAALFPWLTNDLNHFTAGNDAAASIEKKAESVNEVRHFSVKFSRIMDMRGISRRTIVILEDITKEKQLQEDLRLTKDAAEAASRAKSEFLANMSHEIRTPLHAILGFTEVLKDKVADSKSLQHLRLIDSSGKSLLRLINDILDLSRVESGKLKLEYGVASPGSLLNEMHPLFHSTAREKGLDLIMDISPDLPGTLILDEVRLRQILVNLMENAVKFTESGHIRLSAKHRYPDKKHRSSLDLIISVEDTGVGVSKDQREKIFEAFEQQKNTRAGKYGGTGLGLSITRRLLEMMNGEICVNSRGGGGTVFTVTLKGVEVPLAEETHARRFEQIGMTSVCFEKSLILIADDIDYNRMLIRSFLEAYDFDLLEAENGLQVIEAANALQPDLILLDMKMPQMDGYEAARVLRENEALRDIPVIAVTASAMKEDEEAISGLCDGHLMKPVGKGDLISALMKFLPHTLREAPPSKSSETTGTDAFLNLDLAQHSQLRQKIRARQAHWIQLSETMAIDKIEAFAEEMKETGAQFNCRPLMTWGEALRLAAESFNMERIRQLLKNFQLSVTDGQKSDWNNDLRSNKTEGRYNGKP